MGVFSRINYPIFILTFTIGILTVYLTKPSKKVVIKYPSPSNYKDTVYVDDANNCYYYKPKKEECKGNEKALPVQQNKIM